MVARMSRSGKTLELALTFIFLPLLIALTSFLGRPVPLLPTLWLITFVAFLVWCESRTPILPTSLPSSAKEWVRIVRRLAVSAVAMLGLFALVAPEQLFSFPRTEPRVWTIVMIAYPVVSVIPQEFLYRTFFFERYNALFHSRKQLRLTNAILFAGLHLVFLNWLAVALTFIGGLYFAETYERRPSFWMVSVEHTLYGWFVISLGLGSYLYIPTALSLRSLLH